MKVCDSTNEGALVSVKGIWGKKQVNGNHARWMLRHVC